MNTNFMSTSSENPRQDFLAIVNDPSTENTMKSVVTMMGIPSTCVLRGEIKEAVAYLKENRSPKILIIDISSSQLPISDINELAEVCEPGVLVIALGTRNDVSLFRELKSLGISDYLVKPISVDLIRRTITTVQNGNEPEAQSNIRLGRLISVIGTRGGVGTTTITANLSWILANERSKRILIVDYDFHFGNVAMMLDLQSSLRFKEALESPQRMDSLFVERIMVKHSDRLSVLSGEEDFEKQFAIKEESFNILMPIVRNQFHYVIGDLKRSIEPQTLQFLQNSSIILLVCDLSVSSIREINRFLFMLNTEGSKRRLIIIANRVGLHRQGEISIEDFEKAINRPIDHVLHMDTHHVLNAINLGQPIVQTNSPLTQGLRRVADDITGNLQLEPAMKWIDTLKKFLKIKV